MSYRGCCVFAAGLIVFISLQPAGAQKCRLVEVCDGSPTTRIVPTSVLYQLNNQTTRAPSTTLSPAPKAATVPATIQPQQGDMCRPSKSPFTKADTLTWPLDNSTFPEFQEALEEHVVTSATANMDYIVRKHNCLRSKAPAAGMLKMEWNGEAASQAQAWANTCNYAHNEAKERTTSMFRCGQNIARSNMRLPWNIIMNMWYNEVNIYHYNKSESEVRAITKDRNAQIGHYTQIVWEKTYQVGCGYKDCKGWHYYVCNYCPAGNIDGIAPYTKGQSCTLCQNSCSDKKLCTNTCPYTNAYNNCDYLQKERSICADKTSTTALSCRATCECQGKIYQ